MSMLVSRATLPLATAATWPLLLLAGMAVAGGCASRTVPSGSAGAGASPARLGSLPEEFDPEALGDDFGPIEAALGRAVGTDVAGADLAGARAGRAGAGPDAAGLAADSGCLFEVRVLAAPDHQSAERRRRELERHLGIEAEVIALGRCFAVRIGPFAALRDARACCERIAASSEAGDTCIVSVAGGGPAGAALAAPSRQSGPRPATIHPDANADSAGQAAGRLLPAFGWRLLLEKAESQQEAERVRQAAVQALQRTDVDICFKAPWYNVEMGHYRNEAEAQQALEGVLGEFPDALTVRGQILIPAEE